MPRSKRVYPVPGRYLNGVPHVPHDCDDPLCVDSGAFSPDPPPDEADSTDQDPPDGGSSDSEQE